MTDSRTFSSQEQCNYSRSGLTRWFCILFVDGGESDEDNFCLADRGDLFCSKTHQNE